MRNRPISVAPILCVGHEWDIMLLELLSQRARSKKVVRAAIGKAAPVKF